MIRLLAASFVLVAFVAASLFREPLPLTVEHIEMMAKKAPGPNPNSAVCLDVNFNYCQARFSESIGLDASVNWKQAKTILKRLALLTNYNETSLLTVCANRAKFYNCLGAQYYKCVSLYNLYPKSNGIDDINSAYTYVDTMTSADFICNSGFEEGVNQYRCLGSVTNEPSYMACAQTWNNSLINHDKPFCDLVSDTGRCLNDAYAAACPKDPHGAGWWGCENFRGSYSDICIPGLRCYVH